MEQFFARVILNTLSWLHKRSEPNKSVNSADPGQTASDQTLLTYIL